MLSREELQEKYIIEKKSCVKISEETGFNARTIHYWLIKYNIPRRSSKDTVHIKDMKDFKLGSLVVVERAIKRKNRQAYWVVECQKCMLRFDIAGWKIRHRRIEGCKYCGKHPNFKGCGDLSGNYWRKVQDGAKNRNIDFNVSIEEAWELFVNQKGICSLSGQKIEFKNKSKGIQQTASLDRINSNLGYTPGNIQWVHKDVNKLKGKFNDSRLIELCTMIANYRK